MSLPYPTKVVLPFDIATAQDMNERHANDVALAAGTGLDDEAVTTAKIDDEAVTPEKRSGGFKIGVISGATLGTTGNKAITGVGFTPKLVKFTAVPSSAASTANFGQGSMDEDGNQFVSSVAVSGGGSAIARASSTSDCIGYVSSGGGWSLLGSFVSMDADGFTINIGTASNLFDVAYEAYA